MSKVIFTMRDGSRKEFPDNGFTEEIIGAFLMRDCESISCERCPICINQECSVRLFEIAKVERVVDKCGECEYKTQEGADCYNCKDRPTLRDNFKPKPKKIKKAFWFGSWKLEGLMRETTAMYSAKIDAECRVFSIPKNLDPQVHSIEVEVEDV